MYKYIYMGVSKGEHVQNDKSGARSSDYQEALIKRCACMSHGPCTEMQAEHFISICG